MEEDEKRKEAERERLEDFGPSLLGRTRKYLWDLFEYPQTSRGAQVSRRLSEFLGLRKFGNVLVLLLLLLFCCCNRS